MVYKAWSKCTSAGSTLPVGLQHYKKAQTVKVRSLMMSFIDLLNLPVYMEQSKYKGGGAVTLDE